MQTAEATIRLRGIACRREIPAQASGSFAGEPAGSKLPDQFRPWHAVGVIPAEKAPPHNLSRETIEEVINSDGYQLWRVRLSQ